MLDAVKFSQAFGTQEEIFTVDGKVAFAVFKDGFVAVLNEQRQWHDKLEQLAHDDGIFFQTKSGRMAIRVLCDRQRDETDEALLYCHYLLNYV